MQHENGPNDNNAFEKLQELHSKEIQYWKNQIPKKLDIGDILIWNGEKFQVQYRDFHKNEIMIKKV